MKKIFFGFFLALLSTVLVAQDVSKYEFTKDNGSTYAAMTGEGVKTLVESAKVKGTDFRSTFFNDTEQILYTGRQQGMAGVNIGFDFEFEGVACDKFIACGAGFIMLAPKTDNEVWITGNPTVFAYGRERTIGAAVDPSVIGGDGTKICYRLEGSETEKNRVLTVEFTDLLHAEGSTEKFNFQIKLHETTNQIELFFASYYTASSLEWGVGIEGVGGNRLHIGGLGYSGVWMNGSPMEDGAGSFSVTGARFIGEHFVFSVPALSGCEAPTQTVTAVRSQTKENSINLAVTLGSTGTADAYLVVASPKKETYTLENEHNYSVGDAISDGKVIAAGNVEGFSIMASHSGLEPNTKYYYSIFLYNQKCSGGPVYGPAYVDSAITVTLPPEALRVASLSDNGITLSVKSNRWNDTVLVACSGQDLEDWGKPAGDMKVGDTLFVTSFLGKKYGGELIYKGPASENIVYNTPVPDYTPYFFVAYSRTAEGAYSASYIAADTISKASLPFKENFSSMRLYKAPYGWYGTSGYSLYSTNTYRYAGARVELKESEPSTANLVFPAMNFPEDRDLRLMFEYCMFYETTDYAQQGMKKSDWHENDSLVFEVSADGGLTFAPAYVITGLNADEFTTIDYKSKKIALKGFYGIQKAKLRIRYVSRFKEGKGYNNIRFRNFELFSMDACDYPALVQVVDSSVKADRATVRWVGGSHNEIRWDLSYAMQEKDGSFSNWTPSKEVAGTSHIIEGLQTNRKYAVRMRAVCGTGLVSQWVSTEAFNSGWTPAFVEDFNNLEPEMRNNVFFNWYMPFEWASATQPGSSTPESVVFDKMSPTRQMFYNWKKGRSNTVEPGKTNAAVVFPLGIYSNATTVMRLPEVSVRAEEKPVLVFDYAYGELDDNDEFTTTSRNTHDTMYVWVSRNDGNTFVMDLAVRKIPFEEMVKGEDHIEIPLDSYNGNVRIAFGIHTFASNNVLWLDNIGVVYKCPTAKNLALRAGSLTNNTATVEWWSDPTHSQWKVICRGNGTETLQTVSETSLTFDNLEEATSYTVLVGQDCADTSKWSRVSFTTGGVPCDPVSGITVGDVAKTSARLQWTGSAEKYRIRIRPVAGTAYTYYDVETNSFVLQNLQPATAYEGGVQSVCGLAVGDTAGYVAFGNFTTLAITCFAPTDIEVGEKNHYSAVIGWTGTSGAYQVEYRQGEELTAKGQVTVTESSARIDDLLAETTYHVRVRGICSAGDTSTWSDWTEFSTVAAPACPEPFNLRAETVTATTARLAWSSPEEGAAFALRFSKASPVSWNNVDRINDTAYDLADLQPETVYLWSVMSLCKGGKLSDWAQRERFTTQGESATETQNEAKFSVYAGKGQLHIMNPSFLYIERVRIYTLDGRYTEYPVRGNGNVLLTTRLSSCVVIVEVESAGKQYREKVFVP